MRVVLVYAFDTCLDRVDLLKNYYKSKGFEVVSITSNFSHRKKRIYKADADYVISVREYQKNLSMDRIRSHMEFARKTKSKLFELKPDYVHCIVPCNSLVKQIASFKKKNKNAKVIFDVIDLWPESMPIEKIGWMLPFKIWKNFRDHYLKYGDFVFCECELFKQYLHRGVVLYWGINRDCLPVNADLKIDEMQFCYLGSINNIIDIDSIVEFLRNCSIYKKCVLHIIGNGESKDAFIQRVLEVGVNVIDHKEVFDPYEKQEIFDQCNYGLNVMKSSVVVGLTMKSLDYMCGGLPIINTIQGDTKQFCDLWNIGYTIDKDNQKKVAETICEESIETQLVRRTNIQNLYNTYFTKSCFYKVLDETLNL